MFVVFAHVYIYFSGGISFERDEIRATKCNVYSFCWWWKLSMSALNLNKHAFKLFAEAFIKLLHICAISETKTMAQLFHFLWLNSSFFCVSICVQLLMIHSINDSSVWFCNTQSTLYRQKHSFIFILPKAIITTQFNFLFELHVWSTRFPIALTLSLTIYGKAIAYRIQRVINQHNKYDVLEMLWKCILSLYI